MTTAPSIVNADPVSLAHIGDANAITAQSKSNFSSSFFFLSAEKRIAIRRVYALFRVIDDVVDEEPSPIRQKELLFAWKTEVIRAYDGLTIVPLLKELMLSVERFQIPKEYFLKLIEGCEMDLTRKRYTTFQELYDYCYRVASMVGLVCMKIFEYESDRSDQSAIDLGLALQLTNIIRDVGVDLEKGRVYLPQEDLLRFGVTETDLAGKETSDKFIALMEFQYTRAMSYYESGMSEFSKDPSNQLLAAKIMAHVYKTLLNKIRKNKYPVLTQRVRLNMVQKMGILGRVLVGSVF